MTVYPERNPSLSRRSKALFARSTTESGNTPSRGSHRSPIWEGVFHDNDEHYREYFDNDLDAKQRAELTARLGFSSG